MSSSDEHLLIDDLSTCDLRQYNAVRNVYGKILDLALSNDDISVSECEEPLVTIDPYHKALIINVNFLDLPKLKPKTYLKYLYNKGDYDSLNSELNEIDWEKELSPCSLESAVDFFYKVRERLKNKYIPSKHVNNRSYPNWYTPALKKLIKEKSKYLSKYRIYRNKANLETYKLLRDRVKCLENQCYRKSLVTIEDSIEKNPKQFWSFIKSRSKSGGIPNCLKYQDTVAETGEAICDVFSRYFNSTFLCRDNSPDVNTSNESLASQVSDIYKINIDIDNVAKHLLKLDPSKSAGPDHVSAILLVNCAVTLAVPITILFQKSLSACIFPSIWKSAFVTPVHKKGSKTEVSNYRPISKLCIIAKVFERIIYEQVYSALRTSFSPAQHGFLKSRSTVSNLVLFNEYLTDAMDKGHQVDVVYTDYSKCFDRIDHRLLISKLERIGIRGDLLRWFSSYIDNRSQAVVVNNYISGWVHISSGVPQGSLLGPLLFLIFVNDISTCFHDSQLLCFADDMKIFSSIESTEDIMNLQADLLRLDAYCSLNKLDLNPSKCTVVTFTRNKLVIPSSYTLKGQLLQKSSVVRDLGVVHDSKLLFDAHIESIVAKASRALGFIMRTSGDFKRAKTFKILYCTFVRSNLEYASQIWNPRYDKYTSRIERIQIKFLKYLCYRLRIPYSSDKYFNLCRQFHLLPLSKRREIADVVYLLNISNNTIDCPDLTCKIKLNVPFKTTRFYKPLHIPLVSTNYRQNSYLWRASDNFNKLSKRTDLDLFCTSASSARRQLSSEFFLADGQQS